MKTTYETLNIPSSGASQDRVRVEATADGLLALLADGAGGVSGGAVAAQMFIDYFSSAIEISVRNLCQHFSRVDTLIQGDQNAGDTTGIAVVVEKTRLFGASVGDSEAWFFPTEGEFVDLTSVQVRKPLLGSGSATAIPFSMNATSGILLLCSDGLHKYADFVKIRERLREQNFQSLPTDLADLARMPSRGLQDDLSIVAVLIEDL